ncbi:hypothetical protein [Xanthobacter autotrophicus]|nr:hypothetical protein [Xanthobacter autotrophicus]
MLIGIGLIAMSARHGAARIETSYAGDLVAGKLLHCGSVLKPSPF